METLKEIWEEAKGFAKKIWEKSKELWENFRHNVKGNSYFQMACIILFLQLIVFITCCFPAAKISLWGLEADAINEKISVLGWLKEEPIMYIITLGVFLTAAVTVAWIFSEKTTHKKRRFIFAKLSVVYIAFWNIVLTSTMKSAVETYGAKFSITFNTVLSFIVMFLLFVMLFVLSSKSKKVSQSDAAEKVEADTGESDQ